MIASVSSARLRHPGWRTSMITGSAASERDGKRSRPHGQPKPKIGDSLEYDWLSKKESRMMSSSTGIAGPNDERYLELFKAWMDAWAHLNQTRWGVLYNFLMANSILLLAWSAIATIQTPHIGKKIGMVALCVSGILLGVFWYGVSKRSNVFVVICAESLREIESDLFRQYDKDRDGVPIVLRPFQNFNDKSKVPARYAQTHVILAGIPILFILINLCLFVATFLL
jgi:hypothetical protein